MVEIENLSFGYSKQDPLFDHLNFTIQQGGICGLLGKNGSGKTTLLKIISGLIFADQGICKVLGQIPSKRHPSFLSDIYFLPEDISVPGLTTDHYVDFYAPFYPRFDQALFHHCLKEFDLPQKTILSKLSHGQKKKFLIAFGLATNSRLLILDEPTNGLDIPSKTQFRKLIASTTQDDKLIVISTHQVHDVETLIDRIVIVDQGKIIYQEALHEDEMRIDLEALFNKVILQKDVSKEQAEGTQHEYA